MTLSLAAQQQTCRRQLDRLRSSDLRRHDLLDVGTALMLLIGSLESDEEDVAGHGLQHEYGIGSDANAGVRDDLAWIRSHARSASLEELRTRTRRAANELCRELSVTQSDEVSA